MDHASDASDSTMATPVNPLTRDANGNPSGGGDKVDAYALHLPPSRSFVK